MLPCRHCLTVVPHTCVPVLVLLSSCFPVRDGVPLLCVCARLRVTTRVPMSDVCPAGSAPRRAGSVGPRYTPYSLTVAPLSPAGSRLCWPSCGRRMVSTSCTGAPATSTASSSPWPSVSRWAWGGGPGLGLGALPAWTPAHRPLPPTAGTGHTAHAPA